MNTNANDDRESDALVDPGDDARIMQPVQEEPDGTVEPDEPDIPSTAEATDVAYPAHADDAES